MAAADVAAGPLETSTHATQVTPIRTLRTARILADDTLAAHENTRHSCPRARAAAVAEPGAFSRRTGAHDRAEDRAPRAAEDYAAAASEGRPARRATPGYTRLGHGHGVLGRGGTERSRLSPATRRKRRPDHRRRSQR